MNNFYKLSVLLSFVFISSGLFGATITWNGGNGSWGTASNWDLGVLPNYNDVVIINSGNVAVDNIGEANRIELNGGILTVTSFLLVSPTIPGTSGSIQGLNIADGATFINQHITAIYESGSLPSGFKRLVFNDGTFLNELGAHVYLAGSSFTGFHNYSCNSFTNNGTIDMIGVNSGIYSICDLYNYGTINIESASGSIAVQNLLYNGNLGAMNLNNTITGGGTATALINNYGAINLTLESPVSHAIDMGQKMIIQSTGSLNISGLFGDGISTNENTELLNYGDISISADQAYSFDLSIAGIFINYEGGSVVASTHYGLGIFDTGNILNEGTWHMNSNSNGNYSRVNNYGIFTNSLQGKLYIDGKMWLETGSTFTNEGHMFLITDIAQDLINGTFNNTAALNDVYGNLPVINNESVIARPLTKNTYANVPKSNALALGNNIGAKASKYWYTTATGNVIGGTYSSKNNSITPHNNAIGLSSLYVDLTILSSGVKLRHEVKFANPIQSNNLAKETETESENYFIAAFPNPTTEFLNVDIRNSKFDETFQARLVNGLGQTVAVTDCVDRCQLVIPNELINGIYYLSIEKEGKQIQAPTKIKVLR